MSGEHLREGLIAGEDGEFSPIEKPVDTASADTDSDQAVQEDHSYPTNESSLNNFHNKENGTRTTEDGLKEDMYVDCPDEIENSESEQNYEENEIIQDNHLHGSDSGINAQHLIAEIKMLRDMHEKAVSEKEKFAQEYEEERTVFARELARLFYQLKGLNEKQSSPNENSGRSVDDFQVDGASLNNMITECFGFLDIALNERTQTLEKSNGLSALQVKDQEIDLLSAKVVELGKDHQQIEEIVSVISSSLSITFHQEELSKGDLLEKLSNIDRSVTFLAEKYSFFLSETDQLRACLTSVGSDLHMIDEFGIFVIAHDKILELRRTEENLFQNISYLENEKTILLEQLEEQKSISERVNIEIEKIRAGLEQEKNRYTNTKEKLSMAVTKGKALVQQRDSLKLSLAEKTSELDKCLAELKELSSSLEAAGSLQESVAEKNMTLETCEGILSECGSGVNLQPLDIVGKLRILADENKSLKSLSQQHHKLTEALSTLTVPETIMSDELDSRIYWLAESFHLSKEETTRLQNEIIRKEAAANAEIDLLTSLLLVEMQEKSYLLSVFEDLTNDCKANKHLQYELAEANEAANNAIDNLNASLLAEHREKSHLQVELENLGNKFEAIVQKECHLSTEKDQTLSILLEESGLEKGCLQDVLTTKSQMTSIIDTCIAKIKENSCHLVSAASAEIFGRLQTLLYIRDYEMRLYKIIAEEETLDRLEANQLSNKLEKMIQDFKIQEDEKVIMQKSHDQLEEKCAVLREKLSMAVKKGKGLFQERENLKVSLNEKVTEIDRLKSELQMNLTAYNECVDQITKLSYEVNRISPLETDLVHTQERAKQLEQLFSESNNMLQRCMESIEGITTPQQLIFEDAAEKVKWFVGYLNEQDTAKMKVEQELREAKDEMSSLANKLLESQRVSKTLEDSLSLAEKNINVLLDDKKQITVSKEILEEELQKTKEEASLHSSKFDEVFVGKQSLEDALSLAENNISRFMNDRDTAEESKILAEEQLLKLKEEFSFHISKLADAEKTIQSLEFALSEAQNNVSLLTEENNKVQISIANLDNEVKISREEAQSQARKFLDASYSIKSLEDALQQAESNIADLVQEKKIAELEILQLNSNLKSCFEELAGIHGSRESLSLELVDQLKHLNFLLKDEALSTLLKKCFGENIANLRQMFFLLKEIETFHQKNLDVLQNGPIMEDASSALTTLSSLDDAFNMDSLKDGVTEIDDESMPKMIERFQLRVKLLGDKVEIFSSVMDESIEALSNGLQETRDGTIRMSDYIKSMKQELKDQEVKRERQEDYIKSLERDLNVILATCAEATEELKLNAQKNILELKSFPEFDEIMPMDIESFGGETGDASATHANGYVETAEKLILAARHNQDLSKRFLDAVKQLTSVRNDMKNKLRETEITCDKILEERNLHRTKISKLETDLETLQNTCHELTLKVDDYKGENDELSKKELQLLTSLSKVQELEKSPLSVSQIKSMSNKLKEVEAPDAMSAIGDEELKDSAIITKLFFVIDSFNGSAQKVKALLSEKEELQLIIEKKVLEIGFLENKIEELINNEKAIGETMNQLVEVESGLRDILRKLGGKDMLVDNYKVAGALWLLSLLDKLVMTSMQESDHLKSKNEELSAKLLETRRVVDDLSNKVKSLEDFNHVRIPPVEMDLDRGTFITSSSPQSEISEVPEMAVLGKSNIPHIPSAAHARTLRKGSSEHLAISIDSESERLVNKESNEEKGHIFNSLTTSGLIPRQGRTAADRIDGIWVLGSRALMSHPRGRLGLIIYSLVLHMWLVATIL